MANTRTLPASSFIITDGLNKNWNDSTSEEFTGNFHNDTNGKNLYVKFSTSGLSDIINNPLCSYASTIYDQVFAYTTGSAYLNLTTYPVGPWDDSTTYLTAPTEYLELSSSNGSRVADANSGYAADEILSVSIIPTSEHKYSKLKTQVYALFENGIVVHSSTGKYTYDPDAGGTIEVYSAPQIATPANSLSPWMTLEYYSTGEVDNSHSFTLSPEACYVDPYAANTFSWSYDRDYVTLADLYGKYDVYLDWRESSESETNTIICGSGATSYEIPADTLPANSSTLQWRVRIVYSDGSTGVSGWYDITTVEVSPTATPTYPKNTMEDGSKDITLKWDYIISTGTEQTGYTVYWSNDGETWESVEGSTSDHKYTISANTLASGTWYWKVKAKNSTGTWGDESDAVVFTVVASSTVIGLSSEQTPLPTISWQCSDQTFAQVSIDDLYNASFFGTTPRKKVDQLLPDGTYTVRVRVQNKFGLFSDWAEAPLTIRHTESTAILLVCLQSDGYITLKWSTSGIFTRYVIVRDETAIGITSGTAYVDNIAIGTHEYKVIGLTSDDNTYSASNTVVESISISAPAIIIMDTTEQIKLPLSDSDARYIAFSESRNVNTVNIYKQKYPIFEASDNFSAYISIDLAYKNSDEDDISKIMTLPSKTVCLKCEPYGSVFGIVENFQAYRGTFYTKFTFTVSRMHYNEEVTI